MRATATRDFTAHLDGSPVSGRAGEAVEVTEAQFERLHGLGLLEKARTRRKKKEVTEHD